MDFKNESCHCKSCSAMNNKGKNIFSLVLSSGEEIYTCDITADCYCKSYNKRFEVFSCNCNKLPK